MCVCVSVCAYVCVCVCVCVHAISDTDIFTYLSMISQKFRFKILDGFLKFQEHSKKWTNSTHKEGLPQ